MVEQIQLLILKGALGLLSALVCRWAAGATNEDAAASAVTAGINGCGKFRYDTSSGAPSYARKEGLLFVDEVVYLGDCIKHLGGLGVAEVNCTDCAAFVVSFANLMGCSLYSSVMEPSHFWQSGFVTHPYCAIGCPDWMPPTWGWGFSYHEVAWSGNCTDSDLIYDACISVDHDIDPGAFPYSKYLPAGMVFSDGSPLSPFAYRECLTPSLSGGYECCVSSPTKKIRRLIR